MHTCKISARIPEIYKILEYLIFAILIYIVYGIIHIAVQSYSLGPHGLQHARLPCPSPSLGACSNSCPLNRWCYLTNSSPFSSCPQSFPVSGSFPVSWLFALGCQRHVYILIIYNVYIHNTYEFEHCLGDSGGHRSLECYSPWSCKELDTIWWLDNSIFYIHIYVIFWDAIYVYAYNVILLCKLFWTLLISSKHMFWITFHVRTYSFNTLSILKNCYGTVESIKYIHLRPVARYIFVCAHS